MYIEYVITIRGYNQNAAKIKLEGCRRYYLYPLPRLGDTIHCILVEIGQSSNTIHSNNGRTDEIRAVVTNVAILSHYFSAFDPFGSL